MLVIFLVPSHQLVKKASRACRRGVAFRERVLIYLLSSSLLVGLDNSHLLEVTSICQLPYLLLSLLQKRRVQRELELQDAARSLTKVVDTEGVFLRGRVPLGFAIESDA